MKTFRPHTAHTLPVLIGFKRLVRLRRFHLDLAALFGAHEARLPAFGATPVRNGRSHTPLISANPCDSIAEMAPGETQPFIVMTETLAEISRIEKDHADNIERWQPVLLHLTKSLMTNARIIQTTSADLPPKHRRKIAGFLAHIRELMHDYEKLKPLTPSPRAAASASKS